MSPASGRPLPMAISSGWTSHNPVPIKATTTNADSTCRKLARPAMRATAARNISTAPVGKAAARRPSGISSAGVVISICSVACSTAGPIIISTNRQTISAATISNHTRHLSDSRFTIAVKRMCSPRSSASTAPSIDNQMNKIEASSSDQIKGSCKA